MKKLLIPLVFFLLAAPGCAQQKPAGEKAYAFYRFSFPGNLPVDENGNPEHRVDTLYQVYLETTQKAPVITYVSLYGVRYHAVPVEVEEVEVGKRSSDNKTIRLRARPGFTLWQLDLSGPVGAAADENNQVAITDERKKTRLLRLLQPVELSPEARY